MTGETLDYAVLIREEAQRYLNVIGDPNSTQAQKDEAGDRFRQRSAQISEQMGNQEGARRLGQLPAEQLQAVAQRIIEYHNEASRNGLQAVQSLIMRDQGIVGQYVSGSVGMLGFGKTLITLARMFVPNDNSEFDQWLDRAEARLDELLDENRADVQGARTTATDDQLARGLDLLNRGLDESQATVSREGGDAGNRGPSTTYNGGDGVARSIQLADFVAAVTANTDLEADEKRQLIQGATAFARVGDTNANELNAAEIALVRESQAYRELDDTERASLNRAVPALVPAGP
jgi:hypothetical protein